MPQAIAIAVAAFWESAVVYYAVYAIATVAISYGLSKLSQSLAGDKKGSAISAAQNPGRDVSLRGTVTPRQIIYGQIRSGGFMAYLNVAGLHNNQLIVVIAYAGHQCEDIVEYSVDNVRIRKTDIDGSGNVTLPHFRNLANTFTTYELQIFPHLGTSTQTVDSFVNSAVSEWDATHKGLGLTYCVFVLNFDPKVWANGAPQDFFGIVKGRRLYDERLDSTNGGSGSQRANDATTWTWSRNWALAVRDFISGGSITYDIATPNKLLLGGELDSRIDAAYVIAAANHADESCTTPIPALSGTLTWTNGSAVVIGISTQFTYEFPAGTIKLLGPDSNFYTISTVDSDTQITLTAVFTGTTTTGATTQWNTTASTTITESRFTCDCQISLDATLFSSLTTLLTAGIGHVSYTGGKYRIFAGVYDSPSVTLNADDIVGAMDTVTSPNTEDLYNSVGGTFFDEQRGWQQQSFPNQTSSSYQTDDGGLYTRNINLLATRGNYRAQRIANVHLLQSRNKITINFSKLSPKAAQIGEWETFNLTLPEFGYVNQVFRCIEWTFLPDGFISINARIEGSALYADLASGSYQLPRNITAAQPITTLPAPPTALSVSGFPTYIQIIVTNALPIVPGTITELWEHTSSSPFSSATKIDEGEKSVFIIAKPDSIVRYYWVRNRLSGQVSATFPITTGSAGSTKIGLYVARGSCVVSGDTARKVSTGAAAWDSDVYSYQTYENGCQVSFMADPPASGSWDFMLGLNSDPLTDQNYTSLDYAFECFTGGNWTIYESGSSTGVTGTFAPTTDTFFIKYDGQKIQYFVSGVLKRTVETRGKVLFMDSSFFYPNSAVRNLDFAPITTAASIPWISRGNCVADATTMRKVGGSSAWDSDVYSYEAYANGCTVSFNAEQTTLGFMIGLNSDPTTDQTYTSLDYAWYCVSDGTTAIYESGSNTGATSAGYTTTTQFSIVYDGRFVRYLKDGAVIRTTPVKDKTFFMDSSFFGPGAAARNVFFNASGAATPSKFIATGNCVATDSTMSKVGGSTAWDSNVYSIEGFSAFAACQFKPNNATHNLMAGLADQPWTTASYTGINRAFFLSNTSTWEIYEAGSATGVTGSYTTFRTVFAISYSSPNVFYLVDGNVVRSTTLTPTAGLVYFDCAVNEPAGGIYNVGFGPGLNDLAETPTIGTGAISPTAVSSSPADGSINYPSVTQIILESAGINASASLTPAHGTSQVDVAWSVQAKIDVTTSGAAVGKSVVTATVQVNGSTVFTRNYSIEGTAGIGDFVTVAGATNVSVPDGQNVTAFLTSGRSFSSGGVSPAQTHTWQAAHLTVQAAMR